VSLAGIFGTQGRRRASKARRHDAHRLDCDDDGVACHRPPVYPKSPLFVHLRGAADELVRRAALDPSSGRGMAPADDTQALWTTFTFDLESTLARAA
jgi:hypothetical protein